MIYPLGGICQVDKFKFTMPHYLTVYKSPTLTMNICYNDNAIKNITMNKLIKRSFLNVLGTLAYISLVSVFMNNASKYLGEKDTALSPVLFLMLFVLSASITGSLILGKPILMYISGEKSDAIKLLIYTLAWLAVMVLVLIIIALIIAKY